MIDDYTTEALILHCLTHLRRAPARFIDRYLVTQWAKSPRSVRNGLWRLTKVGRIERIGYGLYQLVGAGQAEHEADTLTTPLP